MTLPYFLLAIGFFYEPQAIAASPEAVTITSVDGATMAASYRSCGPGSPAVLLFPMCDDRNPADGWAPVAERLRSAGVSSLILSYRIQGGTGAGKSRNQEPAHADAALAYLRSRSGDGAAIGLAGSSCGVHFALRTAARHPKVIRAVVAFAGPHTNSELELIRNTPELAVLSGSAKFNTPAPDWASALKEASRNPASRLLLPSGKSHGTDVFVEQPNVAVEIAEWLAKQLK